MKHAFTAIPGALDGDASGPVRSQLDRMLASPEFPASERRRIFLKYVVEETLAGRSDRLKGYTIAQAVFDRDNSFDAQSDPVVRLEARRLRRDLDSYYVGAGQDDPVRISIPKGRYVPHFELDETVRRSAAVVGQDALPVDPEAVAASRAADGGRARRGFRRGASAFLAAAVAVVLAAVGWHFGARAPQPPTAVAADGPVLAVVPFQALGGDDDSRYLALGIATDLLAGLTRFSGFQVYSLPGTGEDGKIPALAETVGEGGPAYVIGGNVRADTGRFHVTAWAVDAATGRVLWSEIFERPATGGSAIDLQNELASAIARTLGQPYGAIRETLARRDVATDAPNLESYVCVQRAYDYRRNFARDKFDAVLDCLDRSVARNPGYGDAWAMLAWLHLDAGRFGLAGTGGMADQYAQALQAATQALRLAPDNVTALKALASIQHYRGNYAEGERLARRALDLNPNDPDTMAQLGWRLAVRGNFDEGIPLLERAIAQSVNPPGWYYHLIIIDHYLKGEYPQMLETAKRSTVDGSDMSQAFIAMAYGALGDADAARRALDRVAKTHLLYRDPAEFFRRHGATPEITDAMVAGLKRAGWTGDGTDAQAADPMATEDSG